MTAKQKRRDLSLLITFWMAIPLDPFPNLALSFGHFLLCSRFNITGIYIYFIFKDLLANELVCKFWKTILWAEQKGPLE